MIKLYISIIKFSVDILHLSPLRVVKHFIFLALGTSIKYMLSRPQPCELKSFFNRHSDGERERAAPELSIARRKQFGESCGWIVKM